MNEIFRLRVTNRMVRSQYRLNLDIPKVNQVSFGNKSIRSFEPKILFRLTQSLVKIWKHSKEL